jgi:hypothetical protein
VKANLRHHCFPWDTMHLKWARKTKYAKMSDVRLRLIVTRMASVIAFTQTKTAVAHNCWNIFFPQYSHNSHSYQYNWRGCERSHFLYLDTDSVAEFVCTHSPTSHRSQANVQLPCRDPMTQLSSSSSLITKDRAIDSCSILKSYRLTLPLSRLPLILAILHTLHLC